MTASYVLTFHRAESTAEPEAFAFEPQVYQRFEGDQPVQEARFPWTNQLLEVLGRLRHSGGGLDARREVGAILRRFLTDVAWDIPEQTLAAPPNEGDGPHLLTIRSSAAELYALPWELTTLPASNRYLADLPHLLVRYEWPRRRDSPMAEEASDTPPRILFAWSAAGGLVPAAPHRQAIQGALRHARVPGVTFDCVEHVTARALEAALAESAGPTVLHILCHGGVIKRPPAKTLRAVLRWDDDSGEGIDADRLRKLLDPFAKKLRLVVLCAGVAGDHDPLGVYVGSLAQALHRIGIPSVVASRYPMSAAGSVRLTRALYSALLADGNSLEAALLRARAALHSDGGLTTADDPSDSVGCLSPDAYALQLYARGVEMVRGEDGKPAIREVTATYPFARPAPRKKAPFHVPFPRNPGFVGRKDDLEQLHRMLQEKRTVGVRPAMLTGMGGIGKTQLAVEYAFEHSACYPDGVYWIEAAGDDWRAVIAGLAVKLDLDAVNAPEAERQSRLCAAFEAYLRARPDALVIFDNIDDPADMERDRAAGFVPVSLGCRLLFTTRRRDDRGRFGSLEVSVLPETRRSRSCSRASGGGARG